MLFARNAQGACPSALVLLFGGGNGETRRHPDPAPETSQHAREARTLAGKVVVLPRLRVSLFGVVESPDLGIALFVALRFRDGLWGLIGKIRSRRPLFLQNEAEVTHVRVSLLVFERKTGLDDSLFAAQQAAQVRSSCSKVRNRVSQNSRNYSLSASSATCRWCFCGKVHPSSLRSCPRAKGEC